MAESGDKPSESKTEEPAAEELGPEELEKVNGGIALLVPAVQKVREAASSSSGDPIPTESISLNFEKIK